jgi:hypothetical protein
MKDIPILDALQRALRGWWIVSLCMVCGGLLGWGYTRLRPPMYEAQAVFHVDVDVDQYLINQGDVGVVVVKRSTMLAPVRDLFFAKNVVRKLISAAEAQGYTLTHEQILDDFKIQQIDTRWLASVRAADPQSAATLANLWSEITLSVMKKAYAHAVELRTLELELSTVVRCFSEDDFTKGNQCAGTRFKSQAAFDRYLSKTQTEINAERDASRGLDASMELDLTRQAQVPDEPVLYNDSAIIVAGMMIGLILGVILVQVAWGRIFKNVRS